MKVFERGEGEAETVIVGSVHGDEPAGKKAIEKVLNEGLKFEKPVKFIIANEKALEENVRYLEADLNSSFPGNQDSDKYEERLAAKIREEVRGKTVLDLHTTQSSREPFATIKDTENETVELLKDAGVEKGICFPSDSGVLIEEASNGIIVETGIQGTEKAEKDAYEVLKNFLASRKIIEGEYSRSEPELYRYIETVGGDWKFEAENFKEVEKGDVYASRDGEKLVAEENFYPALMSTDGYEGKLGYKTEKIES
ncbi:MAG: succinylglutamate desuccinylase/aspartoacylase family protein [Candidatus Nanohalobium sp.]